MNPEQISNLAHAAHPIKSPLDDTSVSRLLDGALPREGGRVLDLGCGTAEWLLRALEARPGLRAVGVDTSESALALARAAAQERGVADRLELHCVKAEEYVAPEPFDLVLSVGAAHAFGGLLPTLAAARTRLAAGGSVLIGDGYWLSEPTAEAVEMLGDFTDLATTVDRVVAEGWVPVNGHASTRQELDAYEWSLWGELAAWALDHPDDPESAGLLAWSHARRDEWLHTYRDSFGFLTLVLRR
ncbi:methyltransferase domain-containing protein [Streptomyces sp. SID5785]|uniref:SAM-dependent methyltransferase n=1 Tax=Streptomyces sp. SID5785 TaxID=2690309 RepID=UPI001361A074|nr:class I SAM-dependent methyltransferase [Streptomyces sp. SID5785]MZD05135.1 methyltransferase domain-containing protein [Streptomyces sp. SID5785]